MSRKSLFPERAGIVFTLALCCLPLVSCLEPESATCATGLVCPSGQKCAARQEVCIKGDCGDGVVQAGESCDDGNIIDGDGCSRTCESTEACGNGVIDAAVDELCDDGNTLNEDGCSADCKSLEFCGNGTPDMGEGCDDGNVEDGDGCSANCKSNEHCGNSFIDEGRGEVCDDGNTRSGDGCSADCKSDERCGNDYTDTAIGEVCDDGNTRSGDECSDDCKSDESCGNGHTDHARGEQCDDGNTQDGDGCPSDCARYYKCGNGFLDPDEECDDGNLLDDDDCLRTCKVATCGDGKVNSHGLRREECDTKGESALCNVNCTNARCGDRLVNASAKEECDDGNDSNSDGCLNGVCLLARCGDGYINGGEKCDDGNSLSCGTCDATCSQEQAVRRARGNISATAGNTIHDGEILSVSDGQNREVFEFKREGSTPPSHVKIDISGNDQPGVVAEAIADAIKSSGLGFEVKLSGSTVKLFANRDGTAGNLPIFESVKNENFTVVGMELGAGRDCPEGTGCTQDEDCEHGLSCREVPKTGGRHACMPSP